MLTFPVSPAKAKDLRRRMEALNLSEGDFRETFFHPRGGRRKKEGQHGVALEHPASATVVRCDRSKRQALNRFLARRMLVEALERSARPALQEPRPSGEGESVLEHMARMFGKSFQRDIAKPYPHGPRDGGFGSGVLRLIFPNQRAKRSSRDNAEGD